MQATVAAASDAGRKRSRNEDSYCADPSLGLYVVADGMGGHAAGEVASRTTADTIRQFIQDTQQDRDRTWPFGFDAALSYSGNRLRTAIMIANMTISRRIQRDDELEGMATTVAAVLVDGNDAVVCNVGDCRAYLIRANGIRQLTVDHSWVAEQVRAGLIPPDAARTHPWRHFVTRAVSGHSDLTIDVVQFDPEPGDCLLLCSDGLHSLVSDDEMLETVGTHRADLRGACQALVDRANARGGPDNVTVVLVELN